MQTVHVAREDQVSISREIVARVKALGPVFVTLVGGGTFVGMCAAAYLWLGLPRPVSHLTLDERTASIKAELGSKIDEKTGEVVGHVARVSSSVDSLLRRQESGRAELLDLQIRTNWNSKLQSQTSLNAVLAQLHEKPTDQFLLDRKAQLEGLIQYYDREGASLQEQQRRLRSGEPTPAAPPAAPPPVPAIRPPNGGTR